MFSQRSDVHVFITVLFIISYSCEGLRQDDGTGWIEGKRPSCDQKLIAAVAPQCQKYACPCM